MNNQVIRRVHRPVAVQKPVEPVVEPEELEPEDPEEVEEPEEPEGEEKLTGPDYQAIIEKYKARVRSPKTAIRAKCVECMGGVVSDVAKCTCTGCPLFAFRKGKNPFHSRAGIAPAHLMKTQEEDT